MGEDTKTSGDGRERTDSLSGGDLAKPPALKVIGAFGGIRPMASKLGVPVSTVQGWKERGVIPEARHQEVRTAAAAHAVTLDEADLAASAEAPPESAAEASEPEPSDGTVADGRDARDDSAAGDAADKDDERGDEKDDEPASIWPTGSSTDSPGLEPAVAAAARQEAGQGARQSRLPAFFLGAAVFALGAGGAVLTKDAWDPSGGATGDGTASGGAAAEQLGRPRRTPGRPRSGGPARRQAPRP